MSLSIRHAAIKTTKGALRIAPRPLDLTAHASFATKKGGKEEGGLVYTHTVVPGKVSGSLSGQHWGSVCWRWYWRWCGTVLPSLLYTRSFTILWYNVFVCVAGRPFRLDEGGLASLGACIASLTQGWPRWLRRIPCFRY